MKLGLFDGKEATEYNTINYRELDSQAMRQLNIKAAEKKPCLIKKISITLCHLR